MDLRALRYFIEVVRQRNFTRASEILHVTQPTLSKMIRQLEDELQSELLVRGSRGVSPTDIGQLLFDRGTQILQMVRTVKDEIAEVKGLTRGELTLGLTPMISSALFPDVLRAFRARYPHIGLNVVECGTKRMVQAVSSGEIELGMMVEPVDRTLFETRRVFTEVAGVAVKADSPWAQRGDLSLSDLAEENFLMPTDDFLLPDLVRAQCREAGFAPNEVGHSAQWDLLQAMVEMGMGIAVLPSAVCRLFDPDKVKVVSLTRPEIPIHLSLGWRRGVHLSFAGRAWAEISAEVLAGEQSGCRNEVVPD
jgi:DNA-binding transcriptional LysR family regulator